MRSLEEIFRLVASEEAFARLGVDLRTGPAGAPQASLASEAGARDGLTELGWARCRGAADGLTCGRLVSAIDRLLERELPAVMVYAFAETWTVGEGLRRHVSSVLGEEYVVADDAWAWRIPIGRAGWPPHRGIADQILDRAAPEIVNAWVALADATPDRSCMHFVPLNEDPGYPHALGSIDVLPPAIRAAPIALGEALFWNANALHWGGACSERADGPRYSCSFTLCRADALAGLEGRIVDPLALGFLDRTDLVARQIVTYGEGQPDVAPVVLEWARATTALSAKMRAKSAP